MDRDVVVAVIGGFLTNAALIQRKGGLAGQRVSRGEPIRAKIRLEPVREPFPAPLKQYAPPRATAKQRRRAGR